MEHLKRKFAAMGARVQFNELASTDRPLVVNIREDNKGQFFKVEVNPDLDVELTVQDIEKELRHLLLVARFMPVDRQSGGKEAISILCGHDEREWFASRLGENTCSVKAAFDKLKPAGVIANQRKNQVKRKNWNKRKNKGFVRQGEFFFVPEDIDVAETLHSRILKNEPLRMGGGTPHIAQFAFNSGGHLVYICRRYPNGVTPEGYKSIMTHDKGAKAYAWQTVTRDATLYVKGTIRHPDHATIHLPTWHRVLVSGELRGREVAFLD